MTETQASLRTAVERYAARVGSDASLVQGAGGNVSWKHDDVLWVKASGTWLADAETRDIFVPVDLQDARRQLTTHAEGFAPIALAPGLLRPSIEASLHALMPHRVVLHLHAVDTIAHLVKASPADALAAAVGASVRWTLIGYVKPGPPLAAAVQSALAGAAGSDVLFLANHGIVVGGDTLEEVDVRLASVLSALRVVPRPAPSATSDSGIGRRLRAFDLHLAPNREVHALALDPACRRLLEERWALYPDHVVFLGPAADFLGTADQLLERCAAGTTPAYAIVENCGVFLRSDCGDDKTSMLCCYADVARRIEGTEDVRTLSQDDVRDLLGWEAEEYRISLKRTPFGTRQ